ncbi:Uncharacterised protein [Shigella flexneri]|nr:Uncharacterised protein [Shigella flexneri]
MERFFCFDHLLVGTPARSGRTGYRLTDNLFQSAKTACNIVDHCLPIPVTATGLPGMVIPGVQTDFVMFSRFTNDIGIGMTNLFTWPGRTCQ